MLKSRIKIPDRILAILLSFLILCGVMPTNVLANEAVDYAGKFILRVLQKGTEDTFIEGAKVEYNIRVDGEVTYDSSSENIPVTDSQGRLIIEELSKFEYNAPLNNGRVVIYCTIQHDGYENVVDLIPVKQNTKEYRLYMKENPKRIVTVNKKVTGVESVDISNSVKINSEAINGTKPFAKGTTVNLEVNAPENAYISSLKVAGEVIKLDIYQQTFSKAMVITDDFAIDVDFYAGVKVLAAVTPNGKIELNERGNNYTINSDTTNNFIITKANQNIDFVITPNEGYVISHLKINGVEQAIEDNKIFKRRMAFSADSTIQAVFSKEYKVTITFEDDMGKVTPAPDCEGGTVGVVTGSVIDLKATPNVGYRVAWVKHKGNIIEEYTENNKSYERKFEILADQEIEICFQPNNYTVELVAEREYGQVGFWQGGSEEIIKVAYGNDVKLKYQPKANYAIIVNATDSNGQELKPIFNEDDNLESGWKSFTISNVTDNITINVTFTKIQMYPLSEIEISTEGLAREYKDGNVTRYIYKKDAIATISTDKDGIRLHKDEEDHIAGGLDIKSISIKSTDLDDPEKYEDHILKIGLIKVYDANNKTDKDSNWHTIEGKTPNTPYELEIMFDEQQSAPTIKFDREPNEHGYYNDDVTITVSADDFVSGLQSVKYEVLNCTEPQAGELYNYIEGNPVVESVTDLKFDVIAKKIDSGDAKLKVTVTDRAGNTNSKTIDLKINCVPPEVSINTSNEEDENEKKHPNYFNTSRTATVVFKDRADTFIQENAEKCIELLKKNADGEYVEISKASMISWKHDGNVHTATIHFNDEGEYKWSFTGNYTNKAGLSNNGVTESSDTIYSFIIDKTAPDATIKLTASTEEPTVAPINSTEESSITIWKKLVSTLTFGIWRNHAVEAVATATDNMSPMYQIEYYKSNSETALTADELTDAYDKNKFTTEKQIVKTDEIFAIYARVEDYAGNVTYVGTDGVIVDCVASKILITPEGATNNVFNSEFADKGVKVAIEVNDFDIKDTVSDDIYSGIKTIEYWIENENNVVTKSKETLYSFDYQRDNKVDSNGGTITITDCSTGTSKVTTHTGTVPTKDMLTHNWSGNITVNAKENNSDDVYVCVKVTDNAGNFDVEKQHMSINITNPTAEVQFTDEANRIVGDRGYFNHPRTATITITDRASAFDPKNATDNIKISAYDVNGKEIEKDKKPFKISDWESNGDKHTATVTFNADANYEWSFSYKNKVGNNLDTTKIETGTSDTPFKFTVDTVAPEATIKSDNEIWNKILSVLTFGIWKNTPIIVEAEGVDLTSPLNTVEYYVDYSPKVLTVEDLDKLYKAGKFYIGTNTVDADAKFVVYARVEDYAGNVTYVGTDGMIYDSVESGIVITPENTPFKIDEKPVYNSTFKETGVKVDINVRDFDIDDTISDDIYSGIKNIEYWVECDGKKTDEGTLYSFDYVRDDQINSNGGKLTITDWSTGKKVVTTKNTPTVPTSDMLLKEWKGSITVDAVANNSDNVVINV
ncbi:MAG: hypothetical protein UE295_02110, partial [Acutalibacteraceae bacterium]|nr:hypothetical protein [Acutalibacteraceae bacterium]